MVKVVISDTDGNMYNLKPFYKWLKENNITRFRMKSNSWDDINIDANLLLPVFFEQQADASLTKLTWG